MIYIFYDFLNAAPRSRKTSIELQPWKLKGRFVILMSAVPVL